jgi:hypothetical protein
VWGRVLRPAQAERGSAVDSFAASRLIHFPL